MPDTAPSTASSVITSVAELQALYGAPVEASLVKEVDFITPEYRRFIEGSPFIALATSGPGQHLGSALVEPADAAGPAR